MNIDELTLGQIKQIQSMCGAQQNKPAPSGRAVVIIDRGWIVAGDQSLSPTGDVRLSNAVHVFRWERIGFAKMLDEWKTDAVHLNPLSRPFDVPHGSIIASVPVEDGWGVK